MNNHEIPIWSVERFSGSDFERDTTVFFFGGGNDILRSSGRKGKMAVSDSFQIGDLIRSPRP